MLQKIMQLCNLKKEVYVACLNNEIQKWTKIRWPRDQRIETEENMQTVKKQKSKLRKHLHQFNNIYAANTQCNQIQKLLFFSKRMYFLFHMTVLW